MQPQDPHALDLEYTHTMMGFLLFNPEPHHIALIGLGGGSLAKFCHRYLPQSRIQVVEINPHVIVLRDEFMAANRKSTYHLRHLQPTSLDGRLDSAVETVHWRAAGSSNRPTARPRTYPSGSRNRHCRRGTRRCRKPAVELRVRPVV